MNRPYVLRCFGQRLAKDQWQAICIDLNLAAQGESLPDVRRKLDSMIRSYVQDLSGIDRAHVSDLFPRPAPLGIRLKYYYASVLSWAAAKSNGAMKYKVFNEQSAIPC